MLSINKGKNLNCSYEGSHTKSKKKNAYNATKEMMTM